MSATKPLIVIALALGCLTNAARGVASPYNSYQGNLVSFIGEDGDSGSSVDYWYFTVEPSDDVFFPIAEVDDLDVADGRRRDRLEDPVEIVPLPYFPEQRVTIDTLSWERDWADSDGDGDSSEFIDVNGDGETAYFDPYIYLFEDDGSLDADDYIAHNDDSSETYGDGSIYRYDSYLSMDLTPGTYVLAIGAYHLSADEALERFNSDNSYPYDENGSSDHGDYQITFSDNVNVTGSLTGPTPGGGGTNPNVPEPTSLALLGLAVTGTLARRRVR